MSADPRAAERVMRCPRCDYTLSPQFADRPPGSASPVRCPECGLRVRALVPSGDHRCGECDANVAGLPTERGRVRCGICGRATRWCSPGAGGEPSPRLRRLEMLILILSGIVFLALAWLGLSLLLPALSR